VPTTAAISIGGNSKPSSRKKQRIPENKYIGKEKSEFFVP